jgi:hypothetical protein
MIILLNEELQIYIDAYDLYLKLSSPYDNMCIMCRDGAIKYFG